MLLARGARLGAAQIAVAAATGHAHVYVYLQPRVAILATGDELVEIAAEPSPAQIRNSNSYSLAAQVLAAGGEPVRLPIAADEPETLCRLLKQGLSADLLLLSGGVSAGKYDLVEDALREFAAEFFFTGALIQPGRPVVFGRAQHAPNATPTYFFGLPGNPVSTLVTFTLFVRPVLDALSGAPPQPLRFVQARLAGDVRTKTGLTRFLPARLVGDMTQTAVELVPWQGSGDVTSAARADCLLVVPPDREQIFAGESVSVIVG
jgi:molybdopterin molybdotransferase